jgi:uncharacterized SAM-binding protein YcdF (DUF218 family)
MVFEKSMWQTVLEIFVFPPALNIALIIIALISMKFYFRFSVFLIILSLVLLYVFSINVVASNLAKGLIKYPVITASSVKKYPSAKAIVVLSGGNSFASRPYNLQRLEAAVLVQKLTGLPILTSGHPGAASMKNILEDEMGAKVQYVEDKSKTTWQNAIASTAILKEHNIKSFYLVTNSWHMKRAMWAFKKQGLDPIPAPTDSGVRQIKYDRYRNWLPNSSALAISNFSLHEYIGSLYYRWKY